MIPIKILINFLYKKIEAGMSLLLIIQVIIEIQYAKMNYHTLNLYFIHIELSACLSNNFLNIIK